MNLLDKAKTLALVSLSVFLFSGAYFWWVSAQSEKQLTAQASAVLGHANETLTRLDMSTLLLNASVSELGIDMQNAANDIHETRLAIQGVTTRLDTTIDLINAKCPKGDGSIQEVDADKGCGLLANVNTTLRTTRGAIGTLEKAGNNFDKNEATFYTQEADLYAQGLKAVKAFNDLVTSKDLTDALHHSANVTDHMDGITGDFQTKFHTFLYPPKCVGKACWLKKAVPYIITGSKLLEPAYYGWSMLQGLP